MYTIGDFLISLKNANKAYKKELIYSYSKAVYSIAKILEKQDLLKKITLKQEKNKKTLIVELKYEKNLPVITNIKLISRPSVHHYLAKNKLKKAGRDALGIISTNQGMMTITEAQKKGIGGEFICQIY